eukprot:TRINITY_DN4388_c0_g1_i1.p2 TRINITY_DN4388_c0_g1~~TRINITY_DN4388_c0_g1_i1.p2  ORF type:complete len:153 (-),score=4.43 TRINITY_DN4388_c0_g1_i1:427-885(-)
MHLPRRRCARLRALHLAALRTIPVSSRAAACSPASVVFRCSPHQLWISLDGGVLGRRRCCSPPFPPPLRVLLPNLLALFWRWCYLSRWPQCSRRCIPPPLSLSFATPFRPSSSRTLVAPSLRPRLRASPPPTIIFETAACDTSVDAYGAVQR